MKNGIKMSIAALISSVAVLSAAVPASAAESSGKSSADAVKDVVLLWQSPAEGSDVNGDGEINVLDLMRYKYNIINPVTEPETAAGKFVYGLYRNMLGKDPDPAVAEDYAKQLESGDISASGLFLQLAKRPDFDQDSLSDEEYVTLMYRALLGREPDEQGYKNWCGRIKLFSHTYVLHGFAASDEFKKLCSESGMAPGEVALAEPRDVNDSITRAVAPMIVSLTGKPADGMKLNELVMDIKDGKKTFQEAAFEAAEYDDVASAEMSEDEFVNALFTGLLDRAPSDDEKNIYKTLLSEGGSRADAVRKLAASEGFFGRFESMGFGGNLRRIGSNYRKNDAWYHLEPSGKTYPVTNDVLLKLLDSCQSVLKEKGTSVDDIYKFCISDSAYKYMEKTKTLEELEEKGWTYFADYAMHNYYSVCYYMAAQMDILLEQAGYQCRVVHATHGSGDHYWNQIYINGTWTNYDVTNWWSNYTWDQMVAAGDYVLLGYVRPEYK